MATAHPALTAAVGPTIDALDAALALHRSGVTAMITIRPESDTFAEVERTVRLWVSAKHAELAYRSERDAVIGVVRVDGNDIAELHLPAWVTGRIS